MAQLVMANQVAQVMVVLEVAPMVCLQVVEVLEDEQMRLHRCEVA